MASYFKQEACQLNKVEYQGGSRVIPENAASFPAARSAGRGHFTQGLGHFPQVRIAGEVKSEGRSETPTGQFVTSLDEILYFLIL
jgi:hypothetical protein